MDVLLLDLMKTAFDFVSLRFFFSTTIPGSLFVWNIHLVSGYPFHRKCNAPSHLHFGFHLKSFVMLLILASFSTSRHKGFDGYNLCDGFLVGWNSPLTLIFSNKMVSVHEAWYRVHGDNLSYDNVTKVIETHEKFIKLFFIVYLT